MTAIGGWIIPLRSLPGAVRFSVRTTLAASAALLVAWSLGLRSPHWAAMTVWLVSQPTRGMVVSKGFYRIVGTGVGALASWFLVRLSGQPIAFVAALAAWVGVCAAIANVLRGFRSYAVVLSGVTAAMISLLTLAHPENDLALGLNRLACVFVGIVVAGVVAALFVSRADERELIERSEAITGEVLAISEALIAGTKEEEELVTRQRRAVGELSDLVLAAEQGAAGSRRLFALFPWVEDLTGGAVRLLAASREAAWDPTNDRVQEVAEVRRSLLGSLEAVRERRSGPPEIRQIRPHRDWVSARMSGFRATLAVVAVSILWHVTGWSSGPFMLLATCLFSLVFATSDTPAASVGRALLGGAIAFVAAFVIRQILLPGPQSPAVLTAAVAPLAFVGGLVMANRSVAIVGTEFNMLLLLLVEPGVPLQVPGHLIETAAGLGAGFGAVVVANLTLFPMSPRLKLRETISAIVKGLQGLALDPAGGVGREQAWNMGAHGRILRLAFRASRAGVDEAVVDRGLSLLTVGRSILRIERVLEAGTLPPGEESLVRQALGAFVWLEAWPERVARVVRAAAEGTSSEEGLPRELEMLADALDHGIALARFLRHRG